VSFGETTLTWLVLLALVLSVAALLLALAARRPAVTRPGTRHPGPRSARATRSKDGPLAADDVAAEIDSLRADVATSLRHMAVVRYDAFGDMGGHLSWSMALLDDAGDGVVLSSIHGRSDSRTYAKNITSWTANQQLSPEEEEAIGFARSS
jgi:hypothetical protein